MKKVLVVAIVAVLAMALWGCGGSTPPPAEAPPPATSGGDAPEPAAPENDYPETHLSFATEWPTGHPSESLIYEPIRDIVAQKTGGKLILDLYNAGTLTTGAQAFAAVGDGIADISLFATMYTAVELPVTNIAEYPAGFNSYKAASFAMTEWLRELNPPEIVNSNVVMLFNLAPAENVVVHNSPNGPITKMEHFQGLQLRTNALMAEAVKAWGGTGMVMPAPDGYEAIRSGMVDGATIGSDGASSFKYTEVSDYISRLPVAGGSFVFIMNKQSLANLPPEWQTIILDASNEVFEGGGASFFGTICDAAYLDMEARGIGPDFFEPGEPEKLAAAVAPMVDEYAVELDGRGLDGSAALALYREKIEYYNNLYSETDVPYFM